MKKLLLLSTILILYSCGNNDYISPYDFSENHSDTGSNNEKITIFPTSLNSYWIYESYEVNQNNEIINETRELDSIVVSGETKKFGKKGYIFSYYKNNGSSYQKIRDDFYFLQKDQVWTYETWLNQLIAENLPFNLIPLSDTSFIKILDINDDLWRIYRVNLDNANNPGLPFGKISGKADILCSWEGKTTIKTNLGNIQSDEYLTTISINLTLDIPFIGKQNIIIEREYTRYYANNIGLIKSKLTPTSISLPIIGDVNINGFEKTLIYYSK